MTLLCLRCIDFVSAVLGDSYQFVHRRSSLKRNQIFSNKRIMASKQLINNLGKAGRCAENWLKPLASVRNSSTRSDIDKVTHTGQVFDKDDYRNVRFVNAKRYVNENWGIKLIDEVPPTVTTQRVVSCDGGNAHLGHPKVYINLDKPGNHTCGYCGLRFVKKDEHH